MKNFFFKIKGTHPRFQGQNLDKNKQIYTRMVELADKHQCSPAQLALAWILQQGDDVVPIPGKLLSLACLFPHLCHVEQS